MRLIVRCDSTSHSQTRTTFHRCCLNFRVTLRSRLRLVESFCLQNERLLFEGRLQRVQPCQKHPSTNNAILRSGQAKSGFPTTFQCFREPRRPSFLRIFPINFSVVWFPFDRTEAIIRDRVVLETRSIRRVNFSVKNTSGDPRRKFRLAEPGDNVFLPRHALRFPCPPTTQKVQ